MLATISPEKTLAKVVESRIPCKRFASASLSGPRSAIDSIEPPIPFSVAFRSAFNFSGSTFPNGSNTALSREVTRHFSCDECWPFIFSGFAMFVLLLVTNSEELFILRAGLYRTPLTPSFLSILISSAEVSSEAK